MITINILIYLFDVLYTQAYVHTYNYNVCIYLVRGKFVQSEHSYAADGRLDETEIHYASLRHAGLLRQFYARTKKPRLFRLLIIGGHFTCLSTAS